MLVEPTKFCSAKILLFIETTNSQSTIFYCVFTQPFSLKPNVQ